MKLNKLSNMQDNAKSAAAMLKAIAHQSRLLILCLLTQGEKSVGELQQHSELSQSAFSQHLSVLRKEKLVTTRKESQTVYYSLGNPDVEKILGTLYEIYCEEGEAIKQPD